MITIEDARRNYTFDELYNYLVLEIEAKDRIMENIRRDKEDLSVFVSSYRCPECGRLSPVGYRCHNCGYDN